MFWIDKLDIDRLVQEIYNSIANVLELCLSCINPSICTDARLVNFALILLEVYINNLVHDHVSSNVLENCVIMRPKCIAFCSFSFDQEWEKSGRELIGCFAAASNVTGTLVDVDQISICLHRHGALAFWDYATAGPYVDINMNPVATGSVTFLLAELFS